MFETFEFDREGNETEQWHGEQWDEEQWEAEQGEDEFRNRPRRPMGRAGRARPVRRPPPPSRRPRPNRYAVRAPFYVPVVYGSAYGSVYEPADEPVHGPAYEPVDEPSPPDNDADDGEIGHAQMNERNISLKWFSKAGQPGDRYLFTIEEAMRVVRPDQGGVYIMVGDAKPGSKKAAGICASCTKDCVLKVGIAEEFRSRFAAYLKPGHRWPNQCAWGNLRVYIADIGGFYSLDRYVERSLDRLLRKHGYALPGGRPVPAQRVNAKVVIHNVLPTSSALLASVRRNVAQNRLPLDRGTSYELTGAPANACSCKSCATKQSGGKGTGKTICRYCGLAPCQCGSSGCGPNCSCARCKQALMGGATGRWQRHGNQIQLAGV